MKSRLTALCASLLSASILAGCVSAPPTDPQLKPVQTAQLGLDGPSSVRADVAWWKAFQDPQIDRLADQVMAANPTLRGALARLRAAEATLAVNRTADYPQATLAAQEQRILFSKDYIIPPPYGGTWRWYGQVTANINWSLDFWGKQAALIEQARGTAQAAALDVAAAHLAIGGAFAQAYIGLVQAWQDTDIADATVKDRETILQLTQGRARQGLESEAAVEQARALLAAERVEQTRIAAQREILVHALAALAGQGGEAYAAITRPRPQLDAALPLPERLPVDLLSRRPDILAARARIDAATAGREAAHAEFYPDIDIAGLVGFQAIGLSNLIGGNSLTYGVGPAIHMPLFDAGRIRAQYAGATAGLDLAVADYNNAVLGAVRQTADALTQVKALTRQRAQQAEALAAAERALSLAESRYKSGLSTQIEVLTAEATLLSARQGMAAIVAGLATQRVTLLLCVGGAFEAPGNPAAGLQTASTTSP